jgi:acyl-coenzyme A synthetase/AMP-(fatty) acid ligase
MKTWFDQILFNTRMQPQRPAIVLVDRAITYAMLAAGIESCGRRLARAELGGGAPVAIAVKSPLRQVVLGLALLRIGVPSMSIGSISQLPANVGVTAVLVDGGDTSGAGAGRRVIAVTDEWFAPEAAGGAPLPRGFSGSGGVCRYSLTSGTTGEPKLIRDTVASIGGRVFNNIFNGIDISRNGMLCLQGLSSTWGFANACATLTAGRTLYLADSPGETIAMIELFAIDLVLASTEQVLSLAATARRTGAQVRSLRMIAMSGGVTSRTLLEAAMTHLTKDILCLYGATEIGLISRAMGRDVIANPGLAGFVAPGVEAAVFDAGGNICPAGRIGLIKVRHTADSDAGTELAWIELGDYGWFAPDGRLHVVGRTADGAVTDMRISPMVEAEHVLRVEFDYDDAAALIAGGEDSGSRPTIRFGIVNNRDATASKLQASLLVRGIDVAVELFALASIPRGLNGKVNRVQLKAALDSAKPLS